MKALAGLLFYLLSLALVCAEEQIKRDLVAAVEKAGEVREISLWDDPAPKDPATIRSVGDKSSAGDPGVRYKGGSAQADAKRYRRTETKPEPVSRTLGTKSTAGGPGVRYKQTTSGDSARPSSRVKETRLGQVKTDAGAKSVAQKDQASRINSGAKSAYEGRAARAVGMEAGRRDPGGAKAPAGRNRSNPVVQQAPVLAPVQPAARNAHAAGVASSASRSSASVAAPRPVTGPTPVASVPAAPSAVQSTRSPGAGSAINRSAAYRAPSVAVQSEPDSLNAYSREAASSINRSAAYAAPNPRAASMEASGRAATGRPMPEQHEVGRRALGNTAGQIGMAGASRALGDAASRPSSFRPNQTAQPGRAARSASELRAARNAELGESLLDPQTRAAMDRWRAAGPAENGSRNIPDEDAMRLNRNHGDVQLEAHRNNPNTPDRPHISPEDFQARHGEWAGDVAGRYSDSAGRQGATASTQLGGTPKPGSDYDGHLRGRELTDANGRVIGHEPVTHDQVMNTREDFNTRYNDDLRRQGLDPLDNPSRVLEADGMPANADRSTFRRAEQAINRDGGVMYGSYDAVQAEGSIRQRQQVINNGQTLMDNHPEGSPEWEQGRQMRAEGESMAIPRDQNIAHAQEQIRQARSHQIESGQLIEDGRRMANQSTPGSDEWRRGQQMIEQGQLMAERGGKYEGRLNDGSQRIAAETGGDMSARPDQRARDVGDVSRVRDGSVTDQAARLNATHESNIFREQSDMARNLARDGDLTGAAEMARNANPAQRGQIMQQVHDDVMQRELANGATPAEAEMRARQTSGDLAGEMRNNSTPDRWNAAENRWELNSTHEPHLDDSGRRMAAAGDEATDAARLAGRTGAEVGEDAARAARRLGQEGIDVGGALDAAGQFGQAGVNTMMGAVEDNRDLNAGDLVEFADQASGASAIYGMANQISREEQLRVERGEQNQAQALGRTAGRMAGVMADGLVNDPVQQAIEDEERRAAAEGRDPNYVRSTLDGGARVAGNMTGMTAIFEAGHDASRMQEHGAAAAQTDFIDQTLSDRARQVDGRIGTIQREIDTILWSGQHDPNNPETRQRLQGLLDEHRQRQDELGRIQSTATRTLGAERPDTVADISRRVGSRNDTETMSGYVDEILTQNGAQPLPGDQGMQALDGGQPRDPDANPGYGTLGSPAAEDPDANPGYGTLGRPVSEDPDANPGFGRLRDAESGFTDREVNDAGSLLADTDTLWEPINGNLDDDVSVDPDWTLLGARTALDQASTAGDQQLAQARNVREQGAHEADRVRNDTARQVASADAANGIDQVIGQAVEDSVIAAGQQAADSFGRQAAAQAGGALFGSPGHPPGHGQGDGYGGAVADPQAGENGQAGDDDGEGNQASTSRPDEPQAATSRPDQPQGGTSGPGRVQNAPTSQPGQPEDHDHGQGRQDGDGHHGMTPNPPRPPFTRSQGYPGPVVVKPQPAVTRSQGYPAPAANQAHRSGGQGNADAAYNLGRRRHTLNQSAAPGGPGSDGYGSMSDAEKAAYRRGFRGE